MTTKKKFLGVKQVIIALMCVMVLTGLAGGNYYLNNFDEDSVISFDVNLSICI